MSKRDDHEQSPIAAPSPRPLVICPATKCKPNQADASTSLLVHNHPSGDPKPSRDDIEITREIKAAAEALGIAIHDHLVIGRKGHASFRSGIAYVRRAGSGHNDITPMPSRVDAERDDNGVEVVVRWPGLT